MVIASLVLTFSTAVSGGCGPTSDAYRLRLIRTSVDQIINVASTKFSFTNYSKLTFDEQEALIKHRILEFNDENKLVDKEYIDSLREQLEEDENFTFILNDSFIVNNFVEQYEPKVKLLESRLIDGLINSTIRDRTYIKGDFMDSIFTFVPVEDEFDDNSNEESVESSSDTGEENGETQDNESVDLTLLPIYEYDKSAVSSFTNGNLNGVFFLGIMASRDACINFYNIIASFLNNQVMHAASGIKSPASTIIELLKALTPGTVAAVTSALISYFSGIRKTFISMFSASSGPIGLIVGTIIALAGAVCISILVGMFIKGYQKKGFAIGRKIHSFFNWEWYCGEIG